MISKRLKRGYTITALVGLIGGPLMMWQALAMQGDQPILGGCAGIMTGLGLVQAFFRVMFWKMDRN